LWKCVRAFSPDSIIIDLIYILVALRCIKATSRIHYPISDNTPTFSFTMDGPKARYVGYEPHWLLWESLLRTILFLYVRSRWWWWWHNPISNEIISVSYGWEFLDTDCAPSWIHIMYYGWENLPTKWGL